MNKNILAIVIRDTVAKEVMDRLGVGPEAAEQVIDELLAEMQEMQENGATFEELATWLLRQEDKMAEMKEFVKKLDVASKGMGDFLRLREQLF